MKLTLMQIILKKSLINAVRMFFNKTGWLIWMKIANAQIMSSLKKTYRWRTTWCNWRMRQSISLLSSEPARIISQLQTIDLYAITQRTVLALYAIEGKWGMNSITSTSVHILMNVEQNTSRITHIIFLMKYVCKASLKVVKITSENYHIFPNWSWKNLPLKNVMLTYAQLPKRKGS